jgi:N-acetylmuramoyl-L-alanine amidase
MKLARYFGAGAMLAGVAVFSASEFGKSDDESNVEDHSVVDATAPVLTPFTEPVSDSVLAAPRTPVPAARPGNSRARNSSGRRSRRWRDDYNRYPGPIPTPEQWVAPDGPVKIALQAGHWRANEAPPELEGLKDNGTKGGGKAEWEVNLAIARTTAAMLEKRGYVVDILPAVVPPDYRAHLFISIHADGSPNEKASGYRISGPRRDATGRASRMVELLEESYGKATGLRQLPDVTRRMENYYAFNFRRYEHALHPMTIAVILETGFLTSPSDREIIVNDTERVARGIVEAVMAFPETPAPAPASGNGGG